MINFSLPVTPSRMQILDRLTVMPLKPCMGHSGILSVQNPGVINFPTRGTISSVSSQYPHFCYPRNNKADGNTYDEIEVEIVSMQNVKPVAPTPQHLRTYEVSIIDQLFPNIYVPFVVFYPYEDHHENSIERRKQILKQSLSDTLTRFYPIAGRIKSNRIIDCNDEGVYYVEAKIGVGLLDFLNHPDHNSINRLLIPNYLEISSTDTSLLFSRTSVAEIQVTTFSCGSIAICLCTSHKIFDGYSYETFIKAWAESASAQALQPTIFPNFEFAPLTFPSNPCLPEKVTWGDTFEYWPKTNLMTRRVKFDALSLAELKRSCSAPSRVLAVIGLIWKCVIAASCKNNVMAIAMNIREKSSSPMPPYSMGNIWLFPHARCDKSEDLGLDLIVQRLKSSVDVINADFVEALKGEDGILRVEGTFKQITEIFSDVENTEYLKVSSTCNFDWYGIDFGWGKPVWVYYGGVPILGDYIFLADTISKGIEAWVTLPVEKMAVLERDPDLLAWAAFETSPLQPLNS